MDHPIFEHYAFTEPADEPGFRRNGLGVRERFEFVNADVYPDYGRLRPGGLPIYDEEYFEWIDVLEAVSQAQERFVMMELGAGFGRWLVNAATAVRQTKTIPLYLVAVEAEPTHFAWLLQHLKDNGLNPNEHRLVEAAAGKSQGSVLFDCSFDPADEYGQGILSPKTQTWRERLALGTRLRSLIRGRTNAEPPRGYRRISTVTLASLLAPLTIVDLIDADIQGAEADVFCSSLPILTKKVRRVHLGTHSENGKSRLRQAFCKYGWQCLHDFQSGQTHATSYGEIAFVDGVQSWLNPTLISATH